MATVLSRMSYERAHPQSYTRKQVLALPPLPDVDAET